MTRFIYKPPMFSNMYFLDVLCRDYERQEQKCITSSTLKDPRLMSESWKSDYKSFHGVAIESINIILQQWVVDWGRVDLNLYKNHHIITLRCDLKVNTASPICLLLAALIFPHAVSPQYISLPHLLVLALFRGELLQHPSLPNSREVLPQGVLARCGHRDAPRCFIFSPCTSSSLGVTGCPVHSKVHASFTDVTANCLASDLLGDDSGTVRLVQRFWGETSHKGS